MPIPDELKDLLAECYSDSQLAAKVFLPKRFWRPFDPLMHGRIFDLIDKSDNNKLCIAAPRGIGKTSIINLLMPMLAILFQKTNYIVPVSCTSDLAMQQAENLKYELISNQMINKLYGPLASSNFSKKQWVVNVGGQEICIMPRGAGQQIRGLLYKDYRPGLILVDDLEDPDNMDNEDQRKKKKEWFYADLLNCVDRGRGSEWKVVMLGTILHQDALLPDLLDNPDWDSVRLELCDDNFKSKCPSFMSDEDVLKLYKEFETAQKTDTFYREYKNDPVPRGKDASFPQEVFTKYDPTTVNLNMDRRVENLVIVDPAKTANPRSAHSAIVGVGIDLSKNVFYVRDIVDGKLHYHELIDEIVAMVQRVNAHVLGIEVTSLHEFITYPIKTELIRRGVNVEVIELHARGGANEKGKISRIKALTSFYRQGQILHNPACCGVLERQLMSFPRSKRWDVMDALGYLPEILEIGERYLMPYVDEEENTEVVEREYLELEDEELAQVLDHFQVV